MVAAVQDAPEIPSPKSRKGKSSAPQIRKADARVKASLLLSAETDLKLTVLAKMRSLDRSLLAEKILSDAVRGVVVSLRGAAHEVEDRQPDAA
jgi:hypothetical protein